MADTLPIPARIAGVDPLYDFHPGGVHHHVRVYVRPSRSEWFAVWIVPSTRKIFIEEVQLNFSAENFSADEWYRKVWMRSNWGKVHTLDTALEAMCVIAALLTPRVSDD
jgi:hypothetical protein